MAWKFAATCETNAVREVPLSPALRKMVSLTQRCFSTRNFNWRIRDRFVKMVQPERDLPLHPSLPLHLAFHCLNGMECHPFPRPPVGRRRVRFVFTPELLPHLMMTHCTRLQMHSGPWAAVVTHVRPSVTLQRRSLKLVLARPSLPAGIYDVLNQGGPQMHLPCCTSAAPIRQLLPSRPGRQSESV